MLTRGDAVLTRGDDVLTRGDAVLTRGDAVLTRGDGPCVCSGSLDETVRVWRLDEVMDLASAEAWHA